MTPAEELRAASKLMRERAQAASQGPWSVKFLPPAPLNVRTYTSPDGKYMIVNQDWNVADGGYRTTAEYIAGMHPAVALAVADWLDSAAEQGALYEAQGAWLSPESHALKVARAYLGTGGPQ